MQYRDDFIRQVRVIEISFAEVECMRQEELVKKFREIVIDCPGIDGVIGCDPEVRSNVGREERWEDWKRRNRIGDYWPTSAEKDR